MFNRENDLEIRRLDLEMWCDLIGNTYTWYIIKLPHDITLEIVIHLQRDPATDEWTIPKFRVRTHLVWNLKCHHGHFIHFHACMAFSTLYNRGNVLLPMFLQDLPSLTLRLWMNPHYSHNLSLQASSPESKHPQHNVWKYSQVPAYLPIATRMSTN